MTHLFNAVTLSPRGQSGL